MTKVRDDLKAIYTEAITAADPFKAVKNHVKREGEGLVLYSDGRPINKYDLKKYNRIIVIGSGKATAPMALATEELLQGKIDSGLITVKYGYTAELKKIETIEASHPVPDANGVKGARRIREMLLKAGEDDLVISLISGGGSALLPLPPDTIDLEEKRNTTELLLKSGASIHEVNSIRKHLSLAKGGNLAKAAHPATVINLMISDVVGDNMDVIASGPFVPDSSSFAKAKETFIKYGLMDRLPKSVIDYIDSGMRGEAEENPKEDSPVFKKVTNLIIASNIIALKAARQEASKRGYNSIILSSLIEGETRDAAFFHSRIAREVPASSNPVKSPACIISGGETTVTVTGNGLGGRSMEFALQSALNIDGFENITMASIGTDGTDGPTDAAGAVADGNTVKRSIEKGLDIREYAKNNDSYNFFKELGDLIITGPTNTNVMDVRIILVSP